MRFPDRFSSRLRERRTQSRGAGVIKPLLEALWGISSPDTIPHYKLAAYADHYKRIARQIDSTGHGWVRLIDSHNQSAALLELVQFVQSNSQLSLREIKRRLKAWNPAWLRYPERNQHLEETINAAFQLWLFLRLGFTDEEAIVQTAVKECLPKPTVSREGNLSFDFSAKTLSRKGGFIFVWTSDLSKHLQLASAHEIYFFRHGRALEFLTRSQYKTIYPPGFLVEVLRTLQLFYPTEAVKDAKRRYKIEDAYHVDLEAHIIHQEKFQLKEYPYFAERLSIIQHKYDTARPTRVKQWWFDRRNKIEWATLLIAVIVFILTLFFGLISSVTGILQAYASFNQH